MSLFAGSVYLSSISEQADRIFVRAFFCDGSRVRNRLPLLIFSADARVAQLVEHQLPKLRVAGSNPVSRSNSNAIGRLRKQFLALVYLQRDSHGTPSPSPSIWVSPQSFR